MDCVVTPSSSAENLPDFAAAEATLALTPEAPWPGPAPYGENDENYFFGRQTETAELHRLVRAERLCVLCGVSGLGKTSLLRAALYPKLRANGWLPVPVRLDHSSDAPPLTWQVLHAAETAAHKAGVTAPTWKKGQQDGTGMEALHQAFHSEGRRFWGSSPNEPVTPVLVFDQFEEVFTLASEGLAKRRVEAFLSEMSALLDGYSGMANPVEGQPVETPTDSHKESSAPLRVILCLREDHLAELESYHQLFPTLRRARLRLLPFTAAQARDVVEKAGKALLEEGAADAIVKTFVALDSYPDEAQAEPVLLSLFCWQLNRDRLAKKLAQITKKRVEAQRGKFLREFYHSAFSGLPYRTETSMRRLVENELVDDAGYRTSAGVEHLLCQPGVTRVALEHLVTRRLLHPIDRPGNRVHLEIIHDRLAAEAKTNRDKRRAAEERKYQIQQAKEQQNRAEERRRVAEHAEQAALQRNRQLDNYFRIRMIAVAIGLVALLFMLILTLWASNERKKAEASEKSIKQIISVMQYGGFDALKTRSNLEDRESVIDRVLSYLREHPPETKDAKRAMSFAYDDKGNILKGRGEYGTAMAAYETGKKIRGELVKEDKYNLVWQNDLAVSFTSIGDVYKAQGNLDEALKSYDESVKIRESIKNQDPRNETWQRDLAVSYTCMGDLYRVQAQKNPSGAQQLLGEAREIYEKAKKIREELAELQKEDPLSQNNVAISDTCLGDLALMQKDLDGALSDYRASLRIRTSLVDKFPQYDALKSDLAVSYTCVGNVLEAQQLPNEALVAYQHALKLRKELAASHPHDPDWQINYAASCRDAASLLYKSDLDAAKNLIDTGVATLDRITATGIPASEELTGTRKDLLALQQHIEHGH